ncbi:uncharacterized protein RHOBADRAFT_53104 [Rhodotorula graminis WP1]|uniref:PH domain-containing protein n=1 Tax=Rhodotorula graminis (strain WP1) TaxID=578459 RepID=A0A194S6J9_RHOGW|nr:uncharacterized protein RHOBADRAFT_53104 [Rhodotorula graminis WP1]KPV76120.1 hypothetical protein RHOBADRAFT_53104 [Rhodotorula graminis WP1]
MLRLSSYGASATTSHGYPKSPLEAARHPPAEAFPPPPAAKSSDILINRGHQLKRIARDTATFYQGIAEAHNSHALTLKKLSHPSSTPIATPFPEASLFIPLPPSSSSTSPASPGAAQDAHDAAMSLGGNGSEGWQQILQEARDTNLRTADAHQELAKRITKDVVGPLLRCRVDLKQHLALMEKDLGKHVDAVQRERDTAAPLLARLSTSLTQSSLPLSAPSLAPLEDPVLLRAQLEAQLRLQVVRENDLLAAVKLWSDRTEVKERDTFVEIKRCWAAWEQANSSMLLGNQQQSMFLSATVDSVPPDAEWHHFLRLNHLVLPDTRPKTLDDVVWNGKGDVLTTVVREGLLERQTSILKSWKPAYFILTPSGHLHIYGPPPATVTAAATAPASSTSSSTDATAAEDDTDSASLSSDQASPSANPSTASYPPLTPSAQHLLLHSSPHLSLNLALCTLGPMPTPAPAPSPNPDADPAAAAKAAKKKQPLDAVFTLIETLGKGGKGEGSGARHVVRCKGVDGGWEEMGGWVASIGKFCAPPTAPPPPASPPTPTAPVVATLPDDDKKLAADAAARSPAHTPLATPRSLPPPFAPAAGAGLAAGAAGASALSAAGPPALPDRPPSATSFFSSSAAEPPALPPRDAAVAAPGLPSFDSFNSLDSPGLDSEQQRNSVLVIDDDYDMSRAMGALGVGAAVGAAVAGGGAAVVGATGERMDGDEEREREEEQGPPPPEKGAVSPSSPRHDHADDDDGDAHSAYGDDGASDAGDLGRSLSQSSLHRAAERKERPISPRQGSVRSLAQAWEQQGSGSSGAQEHKPAAVEEDAAEAEQPLAQAQAQQLDVPAQGDGDELDGASDMGDTSFGDDVEAGHGQDEAALEGDKPAKAGKKGKKKRKSKAAGSAKPTERPLPLPSVDPEHTDLGLPSPHSPSFADAQPLAHDEANLHADGDGVSSPPPMVLEEVDEAPSRRSSEERERALEYEGENKGEKEGEHEGEGKKEGEGA